MEESPPTGRVKETIRPRRVFALAARSVSGEHGQYFAQKVHLFAVCAVPSVGKSFHFSNAGFGSERAGKKSSGGFVSSPGEAEGDFENVQTLADQPYRAIRGRRGTQCPRGLFRPQFHVHQYHLWHPADCLRRVVSHAHRH